MLCSKGKAVRNRAAGWYAVKSLPYTDARAGVMALAILVLLAAPPPKAYSDTLVASSEPMHAVAATSRGQDYGARAAAYEPWADEVQGEESDVAAVTSLLDHMH